MRGVRKQVKKSTWWELVMYHIISQVNGIKAENKFNAFVEGNLKRFCMTISEYC